jgi:hypothetical protein
MDQCFYSHHGALSDPGGCASLFDGLPCDVAGLCAAVQGVLLHDYFGGELYGPPPPTFAEHSRATLPIAERLDAITARDDAPLDRARRPFDRCVGTCRDFALMLCAMLRHRGVPARVRCGFANYFGGPRWEDHWVCEHWVAAEERWALADPQLDDAHRRHLGIGFDTADMPRDRFLLAWQAWRACRDGADPAQFGHGDDTGLWFVEVNLVRDFYALQKRETSPWDAWRCSTPRSRVLDEGRLARGDRMAALGETATGLTAPSLKDVGKVVPAAPPWESAA